VLSEEATHTNFMVFGLTRPGFEPTIHRTRDEHANHYATDAVHLFVAMEFRLNIQDIVSMVHKIYFTFIKQAI
jgi:hypothetical protein